MTGGPMTALLDGLDRVDRRLRCPRSDCSATLIPNAGEPPFLLRARARDAGWRFFPGTGEPRCDRHRHDVPATVPRERRRYTDRTVVWWSHGSGGSVPPARLPDGPRLWIGEPTGPTRLGDLILLRDAATPGGRYETVVDVEGTRVPTLTGASQPVTEYLPGDTGTPRRWPLRRYRQSRRAT
jgi:hypothetical protein